MARIQAKQDLFQAQEQPALLHVRVTPKASSARIKREVSEEGVVFYKVYVTVVAEDGKANKAVIELLAKALGLPKSSLTITHGFTSREKIIKIGD